jgi:3',5'-nucleoside bisphosphate phosphatase
MKTIIIFLTVFLITIAVGAQNVNNIQMPELLNKSARKTIQVPAI